MLSHHTGRVAEWEMILQLIKLITWMSVTLELLMVAQKCNQKPLPSGKHRYLSHVGMEYFFVKFISEG